MKKFILKLSLFFGLLIIADIALGGVFKLYDYTKSGEIHRIHSIMTYQNPDLLILGSSRAVHHYDPSILEDSLGLKTFNAGVNGQGITIAYGLLQGISQRNFPKFILCEITPQYDLYDKDFVDVSILYPYIKNPNIKNITTNFDFSENIKLLSNAYRLNSIVFRIIPSILNCKDTSEKGYMPINGHIKIEDYSTTKQSSSVSNANNIVNPIKQTYIESLINETTKNNCCLVFLISPMFGGSNENYYSKEIKIIKKYDIPIISHLNDSAFINDPSLFSDRVHLNKKGAEKLTKIVATELKSFCETYRLESESCLKSNQLTE